MEQLSRRELLAASAGGIVLPNLINAGQPNPKRKRSIRIAHLTDIHVQPERGAPKGMEAAIEHAQGQKDKPDMIITGGDLIMDALATDKTRVTELWDIFTSVLRANVELPVEHTIGKDRKSVV